MGMFGFTNKAPKASTPKTKSFISTAEQSLYQNGGNKPTVDLSLQSYIEANSRLDTVLRTMASVASSARFLYGKEDSKGKFKKTKFAQSDGLYMNDYQTESDFIFELFGTLATYDKVLIIPEDSKYSTRKGMIDWTIVPNNNFYIEVGKNQTIDNFVYKSSTGAETKYKYNECIYITRNLTASNLVYAIPRLKALMTTVENVLGIHRYMAEYINSGGKSSIIAASDSLLSEEQAREIKNKLQEFLTTQAPKAMLMNSEKFSLEKVSDSMTTAGVLEIMVALSNEITKAYNMPLYLLGDYAHPVQDKSIVVANRIWFELQLRPLFNTLSAAFTRYFRDTFGIKGAVVKFDYSGISLLEDSDTDKLDIVERSIKTGLMSINEGRDTMGWEVLPFDGANKHFAPSYLLGSYPISFETFEEDVSRNMDGTTNGSVPNQTVSGDGGANNGEGLSGAN